MSAGGQFVVVAPASEPLRTAALKLLLTEHALEPGSPLAEQIATDAQRFGSAYWNTMVVAFGSTGNDAAISEGQLHAACWLQQHPGKVASVHGPNFCGTTYDEPLSDELLRAALKAARRQQITVAQAIIDLAPVPEQATWYRAGFHRAAELLYMLCEQNGELPQARGAVRFTPFSPQNVADDAGLRQQLIEVIDATYRFSLDCPRLDGLRRLEDVLEGYCATGDSLSSRWQLAFDPADTAAGPIGCLLVADHPGNQQCELIYMGIVPDYRGRGLGQALVVEAQRITAELGRKRLVLAVDADNWPAFRHYAGMGFRTFGRKQVFMLSLQSE